MSGELADAMMAIGKEYGYLMEWKGFSMCPKSISIVPWEIPEAKFEQWTQENENGHYRHLMTYDLILIRIIFSRSEIDLDDIKGEFERLCMPSLERLKQVEQGVHYVALLILIGWFGLPFTVN